jgi:hypothetical protein
MQYFSAPFYRILTLSLLTGMGPVTSYTQHILDKNISLEANLQPLGQVLELLSNKGNFYFSYKSDIIKKDSLVTLVAHDKPIKQILEKLFSDHFEFVERGNYIIIRKAPVRISPTSGRSATEYRKYVIKGYIQDEDSGEGIGNASVYQKQDLTATLTNERGFFTINLKGRLRIVALTVSKDFYKDSTVLIEPPYNQPITIVISQMEFARRLTTIGPNDYLAPDSIKVSVPSDSVIKQLMYAKKEPVRVEITYFGKLLLSSKQKIQSLNLKKFFIERPFQLSFIPGLSTHGALSGQVVNKFSLNILGGYSAGVNGFELGGLFNIDKRNVQYMQVAGLFSIVGGNLKGLQVGGLHNSVLGPVEGLQVAGISNICKGKFNGVQLGGIYNHIADSLEGVQLAGIGNFSQKKIIGVQLSGIVNVSNKEMNGAQVSGIFNYAKKLKGVQIGLINVADTSDGYSIGLINIVLKGYHQLSVFANEVSPINLAFKTGNSKLYSILEAGIRTNTDNKLYSFGYGIGTTLHFTKNLSLHPELVSDYLYLGSWNYSNYLNKLSLDLHWQLVKYISLTVGPSFAVYYSDQPQRVSGYHFHLPSNGYPGFSMSDKVNAWVGWRVGINFF